MSLDKRKMYLETLGEIITEYALEAKQKSDIAAPGADKEFADGYLSGMYRIVTLMQQHAEPYDLSMKDIGLENISESDLL